MRKAKKYPVRYGKEAQKSLRKMDKFQAKWILLWIDKHLEGIDNPRSLDKGLVGNKGGQWCYHVGNYRIIADIQDDTIIILILSVGHGETIYK